MIGGVEKLRPELYVQFLRNLGVFHHREIEIEKARPPDRVPRHIAQRAGNLQDIARRIEPPIRIAQHAIRITSCGAGIVRTISNYPSQTRPGWESEAGLDIDGSAGVSAQDSAQLPPFDELVSAEGQSIDGVGSECVVNIECAESAIVTRIQFVGYRK